MAQGNIPLAVTKVMSLSLGNRTAWQYRGEIGGGNHSARLTRICHFPRFRAKMG